MVVIVLVEPDHLKEIPFLYQSSSYLWNTDIVWRIHWEEKIKIENAVCQCTKY